MSRFDRQTILRGFGPEGQERLRRASVLVAGAGGLGCPVLLYLAAAGVGRIGIVDGDTVSLSNLNRQIIFGEKDEGKNKAEVAAGRIQDQYGDIEVKAYSHQLDNSNALEIVSSFDVIVDCTDNFATRYMINDACLLKDKPLVYGAIYEYEGQAGVFNMKNGDSRSVHFRDLFPSPPDSSSIPDCNENGVLGVLPGIIGMIQAAETIKILTGTGQPLSGQVLHYDMLHQSIYKMEIAPGKDHLTHYPLTEEQFLSFDYGLSCHRIKKINWDAALHLFDHEPDNTLFVDVREPDELPRALDLKHLDMPMSTMSPDKRKLGVTEQNLLLFCKTGVRSDKAAWMLQQSFPEKNIYSIRGGIMDGSSPLQT